MSSKIITRIQIHEGKVQQDDKAIFDSPDTDFATFSKAVYKDLNINYPKFYKMDNLCKLAFLAAEFALKENTDSDTALIFCNEEASMDTDLKHQQTIQDENNYYPSPAVFVYTLPNIAIGEVSIRHQLKTESVFLLANTLPTAYIRPYADYLLSSGKASQVLYGWLSCIKETYHADFCLLGNND